MGCKEKGIYDCCSRCGDCSIEWGRTSLARLNDQEIHRPCCDCTPNCPYEKKISEARQK